jgi:hypothetical protein
MVTYPLEGGTVEAGAGDAGETCTTNCSGGVFTLNCSGTTTVAGMSYTNTTTTTFTYTSTGWTGSTSTTEKGPNGQVVFSCTYDITATKD